MGKFMSMNILALLVAALTWHPQAPPWKPSPLPISVLRPEPPTSPCPAPSRPWVISDSGQVAILIDDGVGILDTETGEYLIRFQLLPT